MPAMPRPPRRRVRTGGAPRLAGLSISALAPASIEPRVALAEPEGERLAITPSSQMPTGWCGDGVAGALGLAGAGCADGGDGRRFPA